MSIRDKYIIRQGNLFMIGEKGETELANFAVKLNSIITYVYSSGKEVNCYELEFCFAETGEVYNLSLPTRDLDKYDFNNVSEYALVNPKARNVNKLIAYYIKSQAAGVKKSRITVFSHLGWTEYESRHIYIAGNRIIPQIADNTNADKSYMIDESLSKEYIFNTDSTLSEYDAIEYVSQLITNYPGVSDIIFATSLLGVLRQLFKDADVKTGITYVYGDTQIGKTSFCLLSTALYCRDNLFADNNPCITRVSSSAYATERLGERLKDCCFIFDDYHDPGDKKTKDEYARRTNNILRNVADSSIRVTANGGFDNNSQLIITGELPLECVTNVGRIFHVHVKESFDFDKIREDGKNRYAFSTFMYYFISYISSNYNKIVDKAKEELDSFRKRNTDNRYRRLSDYKFCLEFAFRLYIEYANSAGNGYDDPEREFEAFSTHVDECIAEQLLFLDKEAVRESINKDRNIAADILKFLFITHVMECNDDCILQKEKGSVLLRIRTHYIIDTFESAYGVKLSAKYVTAYFRDRDLSQVYKDKRQKKYKGKSYITIDMRCLLNEGKKGLSAEERKEIEIIEGSPRI